MLSSFMIEHAVGKRGQEKAYLIDDEPNFDYRINSGAAPVLQDYFFCRGCESRMGYLEGYISGEYRDKLKKTNFKQNFNDLHFANQPDFIREANHVSPHAFTLLLGTILFRLSLSTKRPFDEFELRPDEQEKLRSLIDETLPPYENFKVKMKMPVYLRSLNAKASLFKDLYYVVGTYDELLDETVSMNFAHPEFRMPYNLMMSQVIVLFFFKKPRNGARYLDYFDFLNGRIISDIVTGDGSKVKTIIMSGERWQAMINLLTGPLVKRKMQNIQNEFRRDFFAKYDRQPTQQDWDVFFRNNFPDDL
jgi:hypothetical protein